MCGFDVHVPASVMTVAWVTDNAIGASGAAAIAAALEKNATLVTLVMRGVMRWFLCAYSALHRSYGHDNCNCHCSLVLLDQLTVCGTQITRSAMRAPRPLRRPSRKTRHSRS